MSEFGRTAKEGNRGTDHGHANCMFVMGGNVKGGRVYGRWPGLNALETTFATVGSPKGLSNSISDGLVSSIRGIGEEQVLQITAPISPGSSGGPVFNLKGEVVAITRFQFTEGQNLNFAIPINQVSTIKNLRATMPLEGFHRMLRLPGATGTTERSNVQRADSSQNRRLWDGMFVGKCIT